MAEIEINTLEMVRRIRDEHFERTKNMSSEDLLKFYRREAEAANEELGLLVVKESPKS
jgi:hypothetical protein